MRIISGNCRGRKLVPLKDRHIRPTSDRTREAIFNILGPRVRDANILDLFTGTGAMGIEALSRGATHATLIDRDCTTARQNLDLCRLAESARTTTTDLISHPLPGLVFDRHYHIIFIDPPYHKGYIDMVLRKPDFMDLLADDAWIIAEYSCKENIEINVPGLDILRQKKYSKTKISIINKT